MSPFKHLFLACGLLCALVVMGCSGDSSGPTSPFTPTTLGDTRPGSTTGATISGTARLSGSGSSGASLMTALRSSVLIVRVEGTGIAASVDASGRFTLEGVPPGDVRLHFEGSGINATLTLRSVQGEQTLTIVVVLKGNSAALESDSRTGAVDDDDSADDDSADDDSADDDSTDDDSEDDDSADDDADDDSKDEDSHGK